MTISLSTQVWMRRWLAVLLSLVLVCGALLAVNLGSKRADALLPVSPWSFATIGVTVAGQGGVGTGADQLETPAGLTLDASNNMYIADTANSRIQKCLHASTACTTVAGQGGIGAGSDQLDHPRGVALDASGNIYIADTGNDRIQKCLPDSLTCTTVAGQSGAGSDSDQLDTPSGITLDVSGILYIADTANSRVQKCLPDSLTCTTVAGQGGQGTDPDQLDHPRGVALNLSGNIYIADTANSRIQKCVLDAPTCETVAGQGGLGSDYDQLSSPSGVAVDKNGNVYVADTGNSRVQFCTVLLECTTPVGLDGPGANANQLNTSRGVAVDTTGNLYISDTNNNRVEEYYLKVVTVVGAGSQGYTQSQLLNPQGVEVDSSGNLYIADTGNGRVQKCGPVSGVCTTVAGQGGQGYGANQLNSPTEVAVDAIGNIYIVDLANGRIQKCEPGSRFCTQIIGMYGQGSGANQLLNPQGIAVDGDGNIYIADTGNNRVQKCASQSTFCTTVAGQDGQGSGTNQLWGPSGVALDESGNVYVSEMGSHRVQKCVLVSGACTTVAGQGGYGSGADQLSTPWDLAVDASGNIYIADRGYTDRYNYRVQKCAPGSTACATVAGGNGWGPGADQLNEAYGVAVDGSGNLFIADAGNNRVQKCAPGSTVCTTVTGGNMQGSGPNQLSSPRSVALDVSGNIYVDDAANSRVQKCVPSFAICTTVAGLGVDGSLRQLPFLNGMALDAGANIYGITFIDDLYEIQKCEVGPAGCKTVVRQWGPTGDHLAIPNSLVIDEIGNIYVADREDNRIEKCVQNPIDWRLGNCTTVAGQKGPGGSAPDQFIAPSGVALDASGSIYIADTGNNRVQKCVLGSTSCTTVAGQGGLGWGANQLIEPFGLAVDASGNLYIADSGNHRVQKCVPDSTSCTTVAGQDVYGRGSGSDQLANPHSVAADSNGNIYIADTGNNRVQKVMTAWMDQQITFDPISAPSSALSSVAMVSVPSVAISTSSSVGLSARASSGAAVSFVSATPSTCSTSGATLTVTAAGTCTITAKQEGVFPFKAAAPVSRSFGGAVATCSTTLLCGVRVADSGANEGSGPAGTTVSTMFGIDHPTSEALCVWYSTENATANGADLITAWNGTQDFTRLGITKPKYVILGANKSSGKISTKINYDPTPEEDEYFNVVVSKVTTKVSDKCDPTSAADPRFVVVRDTGRVTIHDDDTKGSQTAFRVADSGATEGSGPVGTTVSVMFGTDRPTAAPLCVWYSTVGVTATGADKITAWNGTQDFTRLGVLTPKYVILGTNRTSGKISTKINYDTTIEEDEYFNIVVSKVTPQVGGRCTSTSLADPGVVLTRDTGRVTIFDDDTPQG